MISSDIDSLKGSDVLDTREINDVYESLIAEIEEDDDYEQTDEEAQFIEDVEQLQREVSEYSYGAAMIREDYFEDYCQELAKDIGAISGDEVWPLNCIDWEKAASEAAMDYTSVTFMGDDYYVR